MYSAPALWLQKVGLGVAHTKFDILQIILGLSLTLAREQQIGTSSQAQVVTPLHGALIGPRKINDRLGSGDPRTARIEEVKCTLDVKENRLKRSVESEIRGEKIFVSGIGSGVAAAIIRKRRGAPV